MYLRNALLISLLATAAASAAVDPALLKLVMPDAKIISGIQVDASKSSPFGKYVLSQMQSDDPGLQKFVADTGFDPRRDLSEIVVATAGTSDKPEFLVAGRGVFNSGKILNTASLSGGTVTNYKGVDMLVNSHDNSNGAIAFVDSTTAIMGTQTAVQAAIDRRSNPAALPADVLAKVQQLAAANDAWFLSTGPVTDFFAGKVANENLNSAMNSNLMQAVLQASGGVKFSPGSVMFNAEAVTRSEKDAQSLADVVRFIAGLVQLNKDKDPKAQQVATLLDGLQLSTSQSTMKLSLSIPEPAVENLFMTPAKAKMRSTRKSATVR